MILLASVMVWDFGLVWRRLAAGVVDWIMALSWGVLAGTGFATIAALVVRGEYSFQVNFTAGLVYFGLPAAVIVMIIGHVATGIRVSSKGDTFGHRLFGLRIVTTNGNRIGRGRALARLFLGSPLLFAIFLPVPFLFVVAGMLNSNLLGTVQVFWLIWGWGVAAVLTLANHVWMMMDNRGRGWHDRMFDTVVVKVG